MELSGRRSARQVSNSGKKFTISEIVDVGVQVAEALHYAHKRGVTHRDIKPSNIIVQSGGRDQDYRLRDCPY